MVRYKDQTGDEWKSSQYPKINFAVHLENYCSTSLLKAKYKEMRGDIFFLHSTVDCKLGATLMRF